MTEPLPPLRQVIKRYNLGARRALGQHFLLDLNLCSRIARAADVAGNNIIEIGPGPGGLTRALLEAGAANVIAVEVDERCAAALEELVRIYPDRLRVVRGDALETDISALVGAPRRIVANLPYNIATPLLIGWLKRIADFEKLTCMFQREVAARLAARPGTKDYGRLSVMTQWLCEVRLEFNVSKEAFTPPPKVASSVVTMIPRSQPLAPAGWDAMETVTRTAFGQRRKMLRSSLKTLNLNLESLGINPTARAEELTVEQFCTLARALEATLSCRRASP